MRQFQFSKCWKLFTQEIFRNKFKLSCVAVKTFLAFALGPFNYLLIYNGSVNSMTVLKAPLLQYHFAFLDISFDILHFFPFGRR